MLLNKRKHFRLSPLVFVKGVTLITLSSWAAWLHSQRPLLKPQSKQLGIELEAGRFFLLWGFLEHLDRRARQVAATQEKVQSNLYLPWGSRKWWCSESFSAPQVAQLCATPHDRQITNFKFSSYKCIISNAFKLFCVVFFWRNQTLLKMVYLVMINPSLASLLRLL